MKVLFLDVDGVLNSMQFENDRDHKRRQAEAMLGLSGLALAQYLAFEENIDPACVARLNHILQTTGAKVVVSSSWRKLVDPEELKRILTKHGFEGEIVGETPDLPNEEDYIHRRAAANGGEYGIERITRGDEIGEWVLRYQDTETHGPIESMVILDDCSDFGALSHRHVLTDPLVGLTDEDAARAIKILRGVYAR